MHCAHCGAIARAFVAAAPEAVAAPGTPGGPAASARPGPTMPPRPASPTRPPVIPRAAVVEGGTSVALDTNPSPVSKISSYLLQRDTLLVLAGLAAVTAALRFLAGNAWGLSGIVVRVMAAGLEASYYFHIIVHFAGGGEHLDPPDFHSIHDDMIEPLRRYVLTLVPILAALVWYGMKLADDWTAGIAEFLAKPHSIFDYRGPGTLFAVGLALWPLMTAIAAIGRSVIAAYNPVLWVKTLRLFGMRYVVGAAVFYALLIAESYVMPALGHVLTVPVLGGFTLQLVTIFLMALRACVLGAVCEPYFQQFD